MPLFLPLDYYGRADHLGRCGDVKQENLALGWRYQDGRIGQQCLEFGEGFFVLGSPQKAFRFPPEAVQRQAFFAKARDEAAQGRKASHNPLHSLEVSDWSHVGHGRDLLWVGLDATFRDYEDTFLGVELDALLSKAFEGYLQVIDEITSLSGLDHDIVHVGLDGSPDVLAKDLGHASLVCGPYISETERHSHIAVHAEWGEERSHELVGFFHLDLMVIGIRIKER